VLLSPTCPLTHFLAPLVLLWLAVDITINRGLEGMISDDADVPPPLAPHASDASVAGSEAPATSDLRSVPNNSPQNFRGFDGAEGSGGTVWRRYVGASGEEVGGAVDGLPDDTASSEQRHTADSLSAEASAQANAGDAGAVADDGSSSSSRGDAGRGSGGIREEYDAICDSSSRRALLAEAALRRLGRGGVGVSRSFSE